MSFTFLVRERRIFIIMCHAIQTICVEKEHFDPDCMSIATARSECSAIMQIDIKINNFRMRSASCRQNISHHHESLSLGCWRFKLNLRISKKTPKNFNSWRRHINWIADGFHRVCVSDGRVHSMFIVYVHYLMDEMRKRNDWNVWALVKVERRTKAMQRSVSGCNTNSNHNCDHLFMSRQRAHAH